MNNPSKELAEQIDFLAGMCGPGMNLFSSDGNLWNPIGGANGAGGAYWTRFYWASTIWFNRMQRYTARWCYMSNAYAQTAINQLVTLALGDGFTYTSENASAQRMVEKWIKDNDWHQRSIEAFKNWLIDGEVFIRVKGYGDESTVGFIDPDLIYTDPTNRDDYYGGLTYDDFDSYRPKGYKLWDKPFGQAGGDVTNIPASNMQHRANANWGQKRGFSWMLPVLKDFFQADALTCNLMGSAEVIAKYAVIRQHEAPEAAAQNMNAQIQAQQNAYVPIGQNGTPPVPPSLSAEFVPPASVIDSSASTTYQTLGPVQYAAYVELLDCVLRKIASHFSLPVGIFSQDKSERGSYASEITTGSWMERTIKKFQDLWMNSDKKLMGMAGLPMEEIDIGTPEIATPDQKAAVDEEDMLLRNKIISRQTIAKNHGLDWDMEKKQMLSEKTELADLFEQPAAETDAEDRNPNIE